MSRILAGRGGTDILAKTKNSDLSLGVQFISSFVCGKTANNPSGSVMKDCLPMQEGQEMWVRSLGQEDPLEDEMATHSSILAWEIPRTEQPGTV